MKTKTLILAALVGAASVASSVAQSVYSANAVGYVTVTIPPGFSMISNPLNGSTSTIPGLFGNSVPAGTAVFKFNTTSQGYDRQAFQLGTWTGNTLSIVPGEGIFVRNSSGSPFSVTFVGTVPSGNLVNVLPVGFSIVSSQVPQSGLLQTDLGYPISNGDAVFFFNNTTGLYNRWNYALNTWLAPAGFSGEPQVTVGQAFFARKAASANWSRSFSVSQ